MQRVARRAEVDLIGPLEQNPDREGIIGLRARGALVRLPSSVYWGALTRWGIFQPQQSQGWYQSHFDALVNGRGAVGRADDPGVIWSRQAHWHPRLPEPPKGFPWEASFALTPGEADFLRGRVEERCAGTLLAWLVRNGSDSPAKDVWDDPDALRGPERIRETVELARRFSLHVEGVPLLYNLIVAETRPVPASTGSSFARSKGSPEQPSRSKRCASAPCSPCASATSARTTATTSARTPSAPRSTARFGPSCLPARRSGRRGSTSIPGATG